MAVWKFRLKWPGVRCYFWHKSIFFYLSQEFKHDLWRLKSNLQLSQKQHLTPGAKEMNIAKLKQWLETETNSVNL